MKIVFAFDKPVDNKRSIAPGSVGAEYEDRATLEYIREALTAMGDVIDLPWEPDAARRLSQMDADVIFNITEGSGERNRESLIPAVAEALGIPCTGSDALAMGISLDKHLCKLIAESLGIATPKSLLFDSLSERSFHSSELEEMNFPLLTKPNTGGSSMGILDSSKVFSPSELYDQVDRLFETCCGRVLVEEFVPGREFAVGLLERNGLESFPIAEIRIDGGNPESFYSFEKKSIHNKEIICPAEISNELEQRLDSESRRLFKALGCRDLARIDYRMNPDGVPFFIEINPLPGLSPYYGLFPVQAEAFGLDPKELIGQLVENALERGRYGI